LRYFISLGIVLSLLTTVVFFGLSKKANAGSTITQGGSSTVTAIEGGYESTANNTYQTGSSNNSTTTSTSNSNTKSSPPSSSAPMVNATSSCSNAVTGGVSSFVGSVSVGKNYRDLICESIQLSNTLSNRGMKISSIQILCMNDKRVFEAMLLSLTPCPILDLDGKLHLGIDAIKVLEVVYNYEQPTYNKWVQLRKNRKKIKVIKPQKIKVIKIH
tara:strand:- start:286 stop:930 length:645 start_codon:yes stop_codon:yes gene_type:complete